MTLALYAHPFSSYCQKVLVALYENDTPVTLRQRDKDDAAAFATFEALWPLKRFPVLMDGDRPFIESPTARPRRLCSMPTGPIRSATVSRT